MKTPAKKQTTLTVCRQSLEMENIEIYGALHKNANGLESKENIARNNLGIVRLPTRYCRLLHPCRFIWLSSLL